ncbi:hypothetical protein N7478_010622 [Penicillium angulare]|uniref:uncharacterized protein n=1 Tax=Penicillium angulare TaxID=116970 RepID=UPI00253FB20D|nr:uncharacterized protein N7478_010622 [Penicillium angulare]KAJ5267814.1 hypothetical protein N7478_010622 [Penicillium angulare]
MAHGAFYPLDLALDSKGPVVGQTTHHATKTKADFTSSTKDALYIETSLALRLRLQDQKTL